jgi:cyclomaltodextrinase
MKYRFAMLMSVILLLSCGEAPVKVELKPAPKTPPQWSKEAIWYQIMVERFHNGDATNDPTAANIQGTFPGYVPDTWQITHWTQNWYADDTYFKEVNGKTDFNGNVIHSFEAKTALRRYGGDLQGVIDKLDYLESLGVNAIYFNPINNAPSTDKFDPRHWHHVDVNFGPDPKGDAALIASEDPADPSTWLMTSADNLFLEVIKQAKARSIRVILEYSWNYTGHTFWAWRDVVENQQASQHANWYKVKSFDDPSTPQNEFAYRGWFGEFALPEIQKSAYDETSQGLSLGDDITNQALKNHIFSVTRRWLDPNGDGDPSDGVDGFVLDVPVLEANDGISLVFWRDYRTFVKSINPQAYLVGEIPKQKHNDELFEPKLVLQGDVFDAVMNHRWYSAARHYFAKAPNLLTPAEFAPALLALTSSINNDNNYAMMNVAANHNSPRLLTSLFNQNKYDIKTSKATDKNYKSYKPNAKTYNIAKLLLAHQFTYIGAPHIWAGDEMGMWGAASPHNRKPLIWPEYAFENESGHPLRTARKSDAVTFNQELFEYYQFLVKLRRANPVLSTGEIEFHEQDNSKRLLSYRRYNNVGESAYIVFNTGSDRQQIILPESVVKAQIWLVWHSDKGTKILRSVPSEQLSIGAESVMVIIAKH